MRRREFLARLGGGGAALLVAGRLGAQAAATAPADQGSGGAAAPVQGTTSNLFDMNQDAAKTVRRPPRRDAHASMTADERDALEHQIRCQCGCTLDVYTCRTTDFSCQVSPSMHRDVMSLVEGGYSAPEILDAFVGTYGERALMSPKKEGFNWAGYLVPGAAIATGAAAIGVVLRGMQRRTTVVGAARAPAGASLLAATDDELARLEAAVRRDD
jgi:cytochrome c-type biogenesis protein CcmH